MQLAKELAAGHAELLRLVDKLIEESLSEDPEKIMQKIVALLKVVTKDTRFRSLNFGPLLRRLKNELRALRAAYMWNREIEIEKDGKKVKVNTMEDDIKASLLEINMVIIQILQKAYPNLIDRTIWLTGSKEAEKPKTTSAAEELLGD